MRDYILSCETTADMTKEEFDNRDIKYTYFHVNMDGGNYADDFGESLPYEDFYKKIKAGATPTTSQVNVDGYIELWEPYLMEGKDILHVTLSTGISGTYNSAIVAAEQMRDKYPVSKIYVIDSQTATSSYGILMHMMADKRDAGASIDENRDYAQIEKMKINCRFFSTDLSSYLRGGRITRAQYSFGTLLGMCPILYINKEGKLIPYANIRTKKKAIEAIVKEMVRLVPEGRDYDDRCYICDSWCRDDAILVEEEVIKYFPQLAGKIKHFTIGNVIGAHTGPGTIGLNFVGLPREE